MANDQAFHTDLGDLESEQLYLEVITGRSTVVETRASFAGGEYSPETAIG